MNGPLYGVADAPDGAVGQAEQWLHSLVRRLGQRPRGDDLDAALRRVSARRWLARARQPEVTGAAVAVLEPGWLTVGQLGSAFAYRVRDHRPVLVAGAGRLGAVTVVRLRPWPGDRYVLATDGFWELLDDQTLTELTRGDPAETCTRLHDLALDRLAEDAAAVVLAFRERS
jgi:serine/threonine protein phosphatase PrpC